MFASVTGSIMAQFEFESSVSPHSSSQVCDKYLSYVLVYLSKTFLGI